MVPIAVSAKVYGPFLISALNKEIDLDSDALKVMLCTSGYTPDQDVHRYKSSVTNEVANVSTTLSSAASAGATTISVAASIPVGNAIVINNADVRVVTAVTGSGPYTLTVAALSTAASSGAAVVSGTGYTAAGQALTSVTVVYNVTTNTLTFDAADSAWTAATINCRYAVIYDSTPSTDATRPLICYIDFGGDQLTSNATFTISWDPAGIATLTAA